VRSGERGGHNPRLIILSPYTPSKAVRESSATWAVAESLTPYFVSLAHGVFLACLFFRSNRSNPIDLNLLISLSLCLNLRRNFLRHFLAEPHFTYDSYRKTRCSTENRTLSTHRIISTQHNVRHRCIVVWMILAAVDVSVWRWVMQFLPGAGKWLAFSFTTEHTV
jgi:hypothetical protein